MLWFPGPHSCAGSEKNMLPTFQIPLPSPGNCILFISPNRLWKLRRWAFCLFVPWAGSQTGSSRGRPRGKSVGQTNVSSYPTTCWWLGGKMRQCGAFNATPWFKFCSPWLFFKKLFWTSSSSSLLFLLELCLLLLHYNYLFTALIVSCLELVCKRQPERWGRRLIDR